jgi:hypothetical protein
MINIDFDIMDQLLEAGCDGSQIAAYFGCHPDTLYIRVKAEKNMDFSAYKAQKRAKGDSALLTAQYDAAVKDKDRAMLIWLGKQRLGQTDKTQNTIDLPQLKQVHITPNGNTEQSNLADTSSL